MVHVTFLSACQDESITIVSWSLILNLFYSDCQCRFLFKCQVPILIINDYTFTKHKWLQSYTKSPEMCLQLNENVALWAPKRPYRKISFNHTLSNHIFHPMMKRNSHVILKAGSAATSTAALEWNCRQLDLNALTRTVNKPIKHHVLETFLRDIITSPLGINDRTGICEKWVNLSSLMSQWNSVF